MRFDINNIDDYMKRNIIMKKIISLSFALFLLISSAALMIACDVSAEETPEDYSLSESKILAALKHLLPAGHMATIR